VLCLLLPQRASWFATRASQSRTTQALQQCLCEQQVWYGSAGPNSVRCAATYGLHGLHRLRVMLRWRSRPSVKGGVLVGSVAELVEKLHREAKVL